MKIATMQLYFSSLTHNILRDIREHSHNATNTLEQVCLIRCDVMLSQLILFVAVLHPLAKRNEMKCWLLIVLSWLKPVLRCWGPSPPIFNLFDMKADDVVPTFVLLNIFLGLISVNIF